MNWLKNIFKKRSYTPIKLTIKAIIRWEQLNKKPFSELNYNSEDEVLSLFYVCTLPKEVQFSLKEFKENLKPSDIKQMVKDFQRQTFLSSQFQAVSKQQDEDSDDSNPTYIKDIVASLVMNGLDVHFAMNDMELCDLSLFLQAHDQKVKEKLTAERLWAFMQLRPHLEKGTTPKDICPFGWELDEEVISKEDQEAAKANFNSFLKNGIKK